MYDNLCDLGREVVYLPDLYLALLLGLDDGVAEVAGGLSEWHLRDFYGVLVNFLDFRADLDGSASSSVVVFAAVHISTGRKVRIDFERAILKYGYGCVDEFIEIVWQNLGGETYGYALGALGEQEREFHREFDRLVELAVIGAHEIGGLRVEDDLLREF